MSVRFMQDQALRAAREGRGVHKFVNDDSDVTAGFVVSTLTAVYYNIPAGKRLVVVAIMFGCETTNDKVEVYMVGCDAVAGGGNATQKMAHYDQYIGTVKVGIAYVWEEFHVPLIFNYSDGHRSVSMAVKATDTDAVVSYGYCGWVEDEGTLS